MPAVFPAVIRLLQTGVKEGRHRSQSPVMKTLTQGQVCVLPVFFTYNLFKLHSNM